MDIEKGEEESLSYREKSILLHKVLNRIKVNNLYRDDYLINGDNG